MSNEQTPIEKAIEALQSCKGLMAEMYAEYDGKPSRHPLNFIDKAITALRAMPTQEIAEPKFLSRGVVDAAKALFSDAHLEHLCTESYGSKSIELKGMKTVRGLAFNLIDGWITPESTDSAEPVAEAMCGDHGGMQGCSCSSCGSPLGPVELTAYCNGCGIRIKWPMADGSEYMVTPPTKPEQPRVVLTDDMIETVSAVWATRMGKDRVSRADFEAGLKEAMHGGLLAPAKPFQVDEREVYTTILVNAIRLSDDDMSRLVRDLVDRGASAPANPFQVDEVVDIAEQWRWKPGTTSKTALDDLRARLTARFGQQ